MSVKWILGIDVGSKKTGVAVGQTVTGQARPLALIRKPISQLQANNFSLFIKEWSVSCIVLGLPQLADKKLHPLEKSIRALANALEKTFSLPVYFADETLSSHEARQRFGTRKEYDSAAAAVMIEDFIASNGYRI